MPQSLNDTIALLSRTPATFNALLRDLPQSFAHCNEGAATWTPVDVVGHLIYADRTAWVPRAKFLLEFGETKTFHPLDREGMAREIQGKSLPQLLDEFARVRSDSLDELRAMNLQATDMERRGKHPTFGPVKLSDILATWAAHDMTHLHQLSRVMAHQFRDDVGPFIRFLGVLQCAGHSADA